MFLMWRAYECYLEQSALGEIATGRVIPQFPGRAWANCELMLILLEVDLMQLQAAFLSSEVVAAEARDLAPEQQAAGGCPLPLTK